MTTTTHRYRRVLLGVFSVRFVCSCGWRTSVVRRNETDIAYAQWQGHRDLSLYGPGKP